MVARRSPATMARKAATVEAREEAGPRATDDAEATSFTRLATKGSRTMADGSPATARAEDSGKAWERTDLDENLLDPTNPSDVGS